MGQPRSGRILMVCRPFASSYITGYVNVVYLYSYFANIIIRMDPALSSFMSNLKRQVVA